MARPVALGPNSAPPPQVPGFPSRCGDVSAREDGLRRTQDVLTVKPGPTEVLKIHLSKDEALHAGLPPPKAQEDGDERNFPLSFWDPDPFYPVARFHPRWKFLQLLDFF